MGGEADFTLVGFFFIRQFKIGLCQLTVTSNKNDNVAHARKLIEAAAKQGASLVMLPVS